MTLTQTPSPTPSDLLARHAPVPAGDADLDAVLARVRERADHPPTALRAHPTGPSGPPRSARMRAHGVSRRSPQTSSPSTTNASVTDSTAPR